MVSKVLVVTGLHLGWDCVVGVFKSEESLLASWLNQEEETPFATLKEWKANNDDFVVHLEDLE